VPVRVDFAVPAKVIAVKFAVAVLLVALSLLAPTRLAFWVGLLAAAAVLAYAVRDLVARDRLVADADGVVAVRSFATRRRLTWDQVERLAVDSRLRFGARSELLELDAGEEIFQYSRYDLGVAPEEALEALEAVRKG
jgi:hypothetical protein